MAKAESLQIDLHWKDKDGKSGFDYYPEHFKVEEYLIMVKKAIDDKDFDQVESIKNNFIMSLKTALFYAIAKDEETAIAMIDNCQRLTLSLSEKNGDFKRTPLILACQLEKPKIVK